MNVLSNLEPKSVFRFFEDLCAIPHGSRNTKAISDYCVAFAKERGLEHYQDQDNNIIIIKEATAGYENAPAIILQGHLDMVCEKEHDCTKDMDKEGLDLMVEGDFVTAKGTTLGAVSMDVSPLKGRQLLNLDSEEEGVFTVSCAGGNVTTCLLPIARAPFQGSALTITISGLQGGHSGTEIHKGRANANMLMGRLLQAVAAATEMRIVAVNGGLKDNAIPIKTQAQVLVADAAAAKAAAQEMGACFAAEYRVTDPNVAVSVEDAGEGEAMDAASTKKVLCMLTCLPNGVQVMSADIAGLVQTSLNLGILTTEDSVVRASFCVRSSVDSQKEMLKARLSSLMEQLGGNVEFFGEYSGWEYLADSPLRDRLVAVFREQYSREPRIEAIHAGVECGIFAGKLPGLDCVSIGPDLFEIHTPRERMSISSVQRLWNFVLEVLKRSK